MQSSVMVNVDLSSYRKKIRKIINDVFWNNQYNKFHTFLNSPWREKKNLNLFKKYYSYIVKSIMHTVAYLM